MKAATVDTSMADARATEKEGDALVRKKDYAGAARKFAMAAIQYGKVPSPVMQATVESKRLTAASNAKNKTDDHAPTQSLAKWAASMAKK